MWSVLHEISNYSLRGKVFAFNGCVTETGLLIFTVNKQTGFATPIKYLLQMYKIIAVITVLFAQVTAKIDLLPVKLFINNQRRL